MGQWGKAGARAGNWRNITADSGGDVVVAYRSTSTRYLLEIMVVPSARAVAFADRRCDCSAHCDLLIGIG